jgi:hypothetical protein
MVGGTYFVLVFLLAACMAFAFPREFALTESRVRESGGGGGGGGVLIREGRSRMVRNESVI